MTHLDTIAGILLKRFSEELSVQDQLMLDNWLAASANNRAFVDRVNDEADLKELMILFNAQKREASQARVLTALKPQLFGAHMSGIPVPTRRVHFLRSKWFRYAAVLLLILGSATFFYLYNQSNKQITTSQTASTPDILPGGNKAILTLSDGRRIVLDSAANGAVAQQGNTKVVQVDAGSLVYQAGPPAGEIAFNTVSTPNGGQYQVMLPDGTSVWLNAASSIRFPTVFIKDRTVEITGEAYLQIAKDKTKPFQVLTDGVKVQVLGTCFNINAYKNEPLIRTMLLTGAVKVVSMAEGQDSHGVVLQPGFQALISSSGTSTAKANTEDVLAWKNGLFNFKEADMPMVMRQLERWYDIRVRFDGKVPVRKFGGDLSRDLKLSQILEILKDMEIKFSMDGRILTIHGN